MITFSINGKKINKQNKTNKFCAGGGDSSIVAPILGSRREDYVCMYVCMYVLYVKHAMYSRLGNVSASSATPRSPIVP